MVYYTPSFPLESLNTLKSVTPLLLAESSPLIDGTMWNHETTLLDTYIFSF